MSRLTTLKLAADPDVVADELEKDEASVDELKFALINTLRIISSLQDDVRELRRLALPLDDW